MKLRCRVIEKITAESLTGTVELQPGQIIEVSGTVRIPHIQDGKLVPIGRVVYKVWAELLGEHILVCERDEDRSNVKDQGLVVYGPSEMKELRKVKDQGALRSIHQAKTIFNDSTIQEIRSQRPEDESC